MASIKFPMSGHPTAPGEPDDPGPPTKGTKGANVDGEPGVPKVTPSRRGHGPGIPGHSTTGPMQPGVRYDGRDKNV